MKQLSLFPDIIRLAHLLAQDSPSNTFYRIWIEEQAGIYSVSKESGTKGRVYDRRQWPAASYDQAEFMFEQRIKAKTNPDRKSPRKYLLITSADNG